MSEAKTTPSIAVPCTYDVPLQDISTLLCCAIEGGLSTSIWRIAAYEHPNHTEEQLLAIQSELDLSIGDDSPLFKHTLLPLIEGCAVIFEEFEDEDPDVPPFTHRLDLNAIKRGLNLMAQGKHCHPRYWKDVMSDNADADTGDVFVQLCLLGEVKYS
jgi:hypothetical protein